MPETCPKCGATINDETVNCPDCQAPVKILRLEAQVRMLEGAIGGWRSGAQQRDEEIKTLREALREIVYGVVEDSGGVTPLGSGIDVVRKISEEEMIQVAIQALKYAKE